MEVNTILKTRTIALYGYPALFGVALNSSATDPALLEEVTPADACSTVSKPLSPGGAALVPRGSCSFSEKAFHLQQAGYQIMLLYNNEAGCVLMSDSENTTLGTLDSITAASLTAEAGQLLKDLVAEHVHVTLRAPYLPRVDVISASALLIMATGTVIIGSFWSAHNMHQEQQIPIHHSLESDLTAIAGNSEVTIISSKGALAFIFVASAMLLVMYFFLNSWFVLLLVMLFAVGAWQAVSYVMLKLLAAVLPENCSNYQISIPCCGPSSVLVLVCGSISAFISVTWFVGRHTQWAWILQDLMGISLMLIILQQLQLPNLKVASVLLPLAFVYDVWWVFIQPLVTGGDSVMIAVASGSNTEQLPMLLQFPRKSLGDNMAYSMLGFGDVILPGLLTAFACRYDAARKLSQLQGYFLPVAFGYGVGLILTYVALIFSLGGSQGQPALLYIVPCTLGCIAGLSWWRGQFWELWDYNVSQLHIRVQSHPEEHVSACVMNNEQKQEQQAILGQNIQTIV